MTFALGDCDCMSLYTQVFLLTKTQHVISYLCYYLMQETRAQNKISFPHTQLWLNIVGQHDNDIQDYKSNKNNYHIIYTVFWYFMHIKSFPETNYIKHRLLLTQFVKLIFNYDDYLESQHHLIARFIILAKGCRIVQPYHHILYRHCTRGYTFKIITGVK